MLSTSTAYNKGQNKAEMTTYKGISWFLKGGGVLDVGERKRETTDINSSLKSHTGGGYCCLLRLGHQQ